MPLHVPAVIRRSPLHAGAVQTIWAAKRAQPPTPSHEPVMPQVAGACTWQTPCGSAPPTSIGQQLPPRPCWLQLTHGPLQATLQQRPSVQNADLHSLSFVQTAPFGLGPQLPFTQAMPAAQSVLALQVVAHVLVAASHPNGTQIVAGPALQRPSPSQTSTSLTEAPLQVPGLHTVPAGCLRQCPCPSQVPSRPQVDAGVASQAPESSAAPFATNEQMPGELGALQVLQVSLQAVVQQTPSAQKPL